jgi:uncharacterized protein YjiS (DUF1127 family)
VHTDKNKKGSVMQTVLNMPPYLGAPTLTWARRRFRNAVLAMAQFRNDIGRWREFRRTVRALQALDNRILADIGLVRSGIEGAVLHDARMNRSAALSR